MNASGIVYNRSFCEELLKEGSTVTEEEEPWIALEDPAVQTAIIVFITLIVLACCLHWDQVKAATRILPWGSYNPDDVESIALNEHGMEVEINEMQEISLDESQELMVI